MLLFFFQKLKISSKKCAILYTGPKIVKIKTQLNVIKKILL